MAMIMLVTGFGALVTRFGDEHWVFDVPGDDAHTC